MATRTRKPATRPAIKSNGAYEEWCETHKKMDTAPYVPNGNRVFSLFADDGSDKGKKQISTVQDWSRMRD